MGKDKASKSSKKSKKSVAAETVAKEVKPAVVVKDTKASGKKDKAAKADKKASKKSKKAPPPPPPPSSSSDDESSEEESEEEVRDVKSHTTLGLVDVGLICSRRTTGYIVHLLWGVVGMQLRAR